MSFLQRKMLMDAPVSGDLPESVDLDGTNDYLYRLSDFIGNTDSKTFTLSCFLYATSTNLIAICDRQSNGFRAYINAGVLVITATNSGGTEVLNVQYTLALNTFYNIQLSCDMDNISNRVLVINDAVVVPIWNTYITSSIIAFAKSAHLIGIHDGLFFPYKGRLSHVFIDYTYRDLSIEANCRLFITEDGKPANGQAALAPIMYFPMTDPETWQINEGTGGDMTANGTVALSGRGPNQDNGVASEFDGVADYLSSTGIGAVDGKVFTLGFNVKQGALGGSNKIQFAVTGSTRLNISFNTTGYFNVGANNVAGTQILSYTENPSELFKVGKNVSCVISVDMTDISKTRLSIGGAVTTLTPAVFTNDNIDFTSTDYLLMYSGGSECSGSLGEVYFDTTYIDLATDNPFWDSETNKPVPVRQVIENTGTTPLIALPIRADDAGKNLGTGGDFTVNSGPFTGARGASEFWARSVASGASSGYINHTTGLTGAIDSKTVSFVYAAKLVATSDRARAMNLSTSGEGQDILHIDNTNTAVNFIGFTTGGGTALNGSGTISVAAGEWYIVMGSVDMADTGKRQIYKNHTALSVNWGTYNDQVIRLSETVDTFIDSATQEDFDYSIMYLTTDYIDFSDEAERLKFVDGLGYPVDIQPAIDAGDIPEPLIYMPFDDPDNLGKNNGTGGDFTVNGTVTQGADVDPT